MFDFLRKRKEKPPLPPGTIRRHYRFFGRVQCVGFRYRAMYAAQPLGVTGWVLNQIDGTVEMELQGQPEQLDEVLDTLQHSEPIRITKIQTEDIPVEPGEPRFRVMG